MSKVRKAIVMVPELFFKIFLLTHWTTPQSRLTKRHSVKVYTYIYDANLRVTRPSYLLASLALKLQCMTKDTQSVFFYLIEISLTGAVATRGQQDNLLQLTQIVTLSLLTIKCMRYNYCTSNPHIYLICVTLCMFYKWHNFIYMVFFAITRHV